MDEKDRLGVGTISSGKRLDISSTTSWMRGSSNCVMLRSRSRSSRWGGFISISSYAFHTKPRVWGVRSFAH